MAWSYACGRQSAHPSRASWWSAGCGDFFTMALCLCMPVCWPQAGKCLPVAGVCVHTLIWNRCVREFVLRDQATNALARRIIMFESDSLLRSESRSRGKFTCNPMIVAWASRPGHVCSSAANKQRELSAFVDTSARVKRSCETIVVAWASCTGHVDTARRALSALAFAREG